MSCFLSNSSLGKKLVMSVTGCFLVLFILFHMSMNIVAIISPEAYNMICALLGANWYALAGTLVLAAGVVIHFIYAVILTLENRKARGSQRYAVTVVEPGVKWASKNMLVLGFIILGGLALHLFNFWAKMQLVEIMGGHENSLGFGAADGASLIAQKLFEKATDINFFVGRAVNPAHQNPNLPITFGIKQQLITSLADCLRKMGKHVRLSYF